MRIYCASDIGDLFEVVQYLHSKYPLAFIVSIGVSLGGYVFNVLLNFTSTIYTVLFHVHYKLYHHLRHVHFLQYDSDTVPSSVGQGM